MDPSFGDPHTRWTRVDWRDARTAWQFAKRDVAAAAVNVITRLLFGQPPVLTFDGREMSEFFRFAVVARVRSVFEEFMRHHFAVGFVAVETVYKRLPAVGVGKHKFMLVPQTHILEPGTYTLHMRRDLRTHVVDYLVEPRVDGVMRPDMAAYDDILQSSSVGFDSTDWRAPAVQRRFRVYLPREPSIETGEINSLLASAMPRARMLARAQFTDMMIDQQRRIHQVVLTRNPMPTGTQLPLGPNIAMDAAAAIHTMMHRYSLESTLEPEQDVLMRGRARHAEDQLARAESDTHARRIGYIGARARGEAGIRDTLVPDILPMSAETVYPDLISAPPAYSTTTLPAAAQNVNIMRMEEDMRNLVCALLGVSPNMMFPTSAVRGAEQAQQDILRSALKSYTETLRDFMISEYRVLIEDMLRSPQLGPDMLFASDTTVGAPALPTPNTSAGAGASLGRVRAAHARMAADSRGTGKRELRAAVRAFLNTADVDIKFGPLITTLEAIQLQRSHLMPVDSLTGLLSSHLGMEQSQFATKAQFEEATRFERDPFHGEDDGSASSQPKTTPSGRKRRKAPEATSGDRSSSSDDDDDDDDDLSGTTAKARRPTRLGKSKQTGEDISAERSAELAQKRAAGARK